MREEFENEMLEDDEEDTKMVAGYVTVKRTYEFWYEFPKDMPDEEAEALADYYAKNEDLDYYNPTFEDYDDEDEEDEE